MPSSLEACYAVIDLELAPADRRVQRHPPLYWTQGRHWRLMLDRAATYRRDPIDVVSKEDIAAGTLRAEAQASSE